MNSPQFRLTHDDTDSFIDRKSSVSQSAYADPQIVFTRYKAPYRNASVINVGSGQTAYDIYKTESHSNYTHKRVQRLESSREAPSSVHLGDHLPEYTTAAEDSAQDILPSLKPLQLPAGYVQPYFRQYNIVSNSQYDASHCHDSVSFKRVLRKMSDPVENPITHEQFSYTSQPIEHPSKSHPHPTLHSLGAVRP